MEADLPNQTSPSEEEQQLKQEEKKHKHKSHVHIVHNHVVQDHIHHYNQLKEHLTGGVSQEICKCQLEEMLLGDEEEARHEKMRAKIEERKRRAAAEERKGVSDAATSNYDIDQALLFIGGETESSKRSCLRRDKKKQCRNTPKAEMFHHIDDIDSDDESVKTMEVANSCSVEEEEIFVQHCHQTDEDWTEVNLRKKKKTSKKHQKMPLFTIEDLSHNVCHGNAAPVDNPRCSAETERLGKSEVWETCLFSAEESGKVLSEEDFPSLQSCGWRRKAAEKTVKVVEEEEVVSTRDQVDGDKADAEEEKDDEIGQEECGNEEGGEEEPEKCEQMTRSCCLRDMFLFPGKLCFCFCDSREISTVSISVEEKEEEPRIGMTRMHAMLSGLVVPFGKF